MSELPLLVVHGDIIWKLLVVVSIIVGPLWLARVRPWRERRRAKRILATLGEPTVHSNNFRVGALQVLDGELRVRGKACKRMEDGEPAALACAEPREHRHERAMSRAEVLELHCGDDVLELKGPVELRVGSRLYLTTTRLGAEARRRIADATPNNLIRDPGEGRPDLFSVESGTRVRVRGTLTNGPAQKIASTNYRTSANRWVISSEKGLPIHVAATEPPRVVVPWKSVVGRSALRSLILGLALAYALGWLCLVLAGTDWGRLPAHSLPGQIHPLSVAAATPFHRGDALARLASAARPETSMAGYRAAIALAELRGKCADDIELRRNHHDIDGAIDVARECAEDPGALARLASLARLLQFEGRYGEANEAWKRSNVWSSRRDVVDRAVAAIASRDWDAAVDALELFERAAPGGLSPRWLSPDDVKCIIIAIRGRDDLSKVRARLRQHLGPEAPDACFLLLADISDGAERRLLLSQSPVDGKSRRIRHLGYSGVVDLLLIEDDATAGEKGWFGFGNGHDALVGALPLLDARYGLLLGGESPALVLAALKALREASAAPSRAEYAVETLALSAGVDALVAGDPKQAEAFARIARDARVIYLEADPRLASMISWDGGPMMLRAIARWWSGEPAQALAMLPAAPSAIEPKLSTDGVKSMLRLRGALEVLTTGEISRCGRLCGFPSQSDSPWAKAARGAGGALVDDLQRRLNERSFNSSHLNLLSVVGPRIKSHRDELLNLANFETFPYDFFTTASVFEFAWYARRRSRIAHLLGDEESAARSDTIAKRHMDLLRRRDVAVLLTLLHAL